MNKLEKDEFWYYWCLPNSRLSQEQVERQYELSSKWHLSNFKERDRVGKAGAKLRKKRWGFNE